MTLERLLSEIWALHQIFRGFGFTADEIVVIPDSVHPVSRHRSQAVAVVRDGTFAVTMPEHEFSETAVLAAWAAYVEKMNALPDADMERALLWVFSQSAAYKQLGA